MSKTTKLLPELRFPEFRGEWKHVPLGSHADVIKQRAGKKKFTVMSIETGVGLVSQMEKFGRDISGNSYKNYTVIHKDDFAYNKSATKAFPEGFIAKHEEENKAAVPNSIFTCFRLTSGEIQSEYLYFQLLNNLHGKWLRKFIAVGARANGALSVNEDDLMNLPVPLPSGASSIPEQQKIADCLGSLDDLITAHNRKLDALQDHKKGLLQQLFPAEGETIPKLRFPEFENTGEWEEKPLGEIAEIKLGKMLDRKKHTTGRLLPYLNNVSVRWNDINTSNLPQMYFNDKELDRFGLRTGDVVVCEGGEPGRAAIWDGRLPDLKFQKAIHRVRFNAPFEPRLLVLYLEAIAGTAKFEMLFTGGGIKHLTRETFAKLKIPLIPLPEQQKIANCLCALDALITAQTEQIADLKDHKKGLMQQLFPNPESSQP